MPRIPFVAGRFAPVLMLAEAAWRLREHWKRLTPGERAHLTGLLKQSHGKPSNLTVKDKEDLRFLVSKLELLSLGRTMLPLGRRFGARGR